MLSNSHKAARDFSKDTIPLKKHNNIWLDEDSSLIFLAKLIQSRIKNICIKRKTVGRQTCLLSPPY